MKRRLITVGVAALCLSAAPFPARCFATPTVGAPATSPSAIPAGRSIQLTVTCTITSGPNDTAVIPAGVNLLRVDATGKAPAILGVMHDDGTAGDAVAGDGIFAFRLTASGAAAEPLRLQVSAPFYKVLRRVLSAVTVVPVQAIDPNDVDDDGDGFTENQGDCDDRNPAIHPGAPETCNRVDDNCDGAIDNGFDVGTACAVGVGACRASGTKVCANSGTTTVCNATPAVPQPERCNGIDDDCDGTIDNGFDVGTSCTAGRGACANQGRKVCSPGGTTTACDAVPGTPQAERCNGVDDNCDGVVDDGFNLGSACSVGVGACARQGTMVCSPTGSTTVCNATPGTPQAERCNGIDDNCDGVVDDGFDVGSACTAGVGACARTGSKRCTADGRATECDAAPGTPAAEICGNGIDEDCDGADAVCPGAGQGVITGEVFDDRSGLPLAGATVELVSLDGLPPVQILPSVSTDARGRFRLSSGAGIARVHISNPLFTEADRDVEVVAGKRTDPRDARLTLLDPAVPISSVVGGTVSNHNGDVVLRLPPGALSQDEAVRVTRLTPQGLVAPLPLGWAVLAAVDVQPGALQLGSPAVLALSNPPAFPNVQLTVARWDHTDGVWIAAGQARRSQGGSALEADLNETGQYAFVLPDVLPASPPGPVDGTALQGVLGGLPPSNLTGVVSALPRILFASPDARSLVSVAAMGSAPLSSGTAFQTTVTEAFDFANGSHLYPDPANHDLTLYTIPPRASGESEFTVTPSRTFDPLTLQLGVLDVALRLGNDANVPRGAVIGGAGGTATTTGARVTVPTNAASEDLPVLLSTFAQADFPAAIPAVLTFLGGVSVDLQGTQLTRPAQLAIPAPSGLSSGAQVLVAQLTEVNRVSYLAVVAVAVVQGAELVTVTDPRGDGSLLFPGIGGEGRYVFLLATQPLGFITGTVLGDTGQPQPQVIVSTDTLSLVALTDRNGRYALAAPLGNVIVSATDPVTKDVAGAAGALTASSATLSVDIALASTPPTVVAVTPADGAVDVPLVAVIRVVFSEPVDAASVSQGALTLTGSGPVSGVVSQSPDRQTLTFRPDTFLQSQTAYTVTVAASLQDLAGNPIGSSVTSQFTTVDLTPPPPPPAGQIGATIPDAAGRTVVSGSQGTADPAGVVVVRNLNTGVLTTVTPNADGSFSGTVLASPADRLELTIRDAAGNATTVALGAFRNPDGSVVVGVQGGRVDGPGGVFVDVPPGALADGTVVKVDPVAESALGLAVPSDFPFAGALRVDLGGVTPLAALEVGIGAPPGAGAQDQVVVAQAIQLPRRQAWTVVERAHLAQGEYVTASPPFPGITGAGTYAFLRSALSCVSYVAIDFATVADGFLLNAAGMPFVLPAVGVGTTTLPAVCNSTLNIQVLDPNTEAVIQQVTQSAPALADDIFFAPNVVSNDTTAPALISSNALSGGQLDQLELVFSEPMQAQSVTGSLVVTDNLGVAVAGTVVLQQGNRIAVFQPALPFQLGQPYRVTLTGATDVAGNPLLVPPIVFTPFPPTTLSQLRNVPALLQALEKCNAQGACSTSARDVALIGNTLFIANGVAAVDEQYHDPANPTRLIAVDVGDPAAPRLIGFNPTVTNPKTLAAVHNASFTLPDGSPFAGDLLLVAGGGRVAGGELNGKLEIYDVTACTHGLAVNNCLDPALQPLKGFKFLSTAQGVPPQPGVPPESGVPLQMAVLHQPSAAPAGDTVVAYVVTVPIGLEAVNIPQAFNFPPGPTTNLAPDGLFRGDFLDVAVLKNRVLAVASDATLSVFSAQLQLMRTIAVPAAARVGAAENVAFDLDADGNLGAAEDADADATTAKDELFDFALIGSGSLTQGCAASVPCGALYIVDLSSLTDLAHTSPPAVIQSIPLPGAAFSVQVDRARKLAYVELRGRGLAIVDLGSLFTSGLVDQNGNGIDDRVLGIFSKTDIFAGEIEVDSGQGIAYVNGSTSGLDLVCINGAQCATVSLRSAALDAAGFPSADGSTSEVLITPEAWGASSQVCITLDVHVSAAQPLIYQITEVPVLSGAVALDLSNGQDTGTISAPSAQICLHTNAALPLPFERYVLIDFRDQAGAVVKQVTVRLVPAMVIAADVRLLTQIDRINGRVCAMGDDLKFLLTQAADVTIDIDGTVIEQSIARPAGKQTVPITSMLASLPGEHDFTITAVFRQSPAVQTVAMGKIVHDVKLNASFAIGHTLIKNVDLWDGHLTHAAQDVHIPGRGLSLDFTRTYSSSGTSSAGPLGAGWTHSYNIQLVHDSCGRFVVIGGEGTGNAFTFDGTAYQPQVGYHSSLFRDPQDSSKFDFFTKARVRYHFEREPALAGETYTLRFVEDPNGNRVTLDYLSGDGDPTTVDIVTDASGRALLLEYQLFFDQKRITRITGLNSLTGSDLLGLEITYSYDVRGNLEQVTRISPNPGAGLNDQRSETYAYTDNDPLDFHNLRFHTDPDGNTTEYVYYAPTDVIPGVDAFGLQRHEVIQSVREPEGVTTDFFYDFTTNTRVVSDPRANDPQDPNPPPPTTYTLNAYGATVQIDAPLGKTTTMQWCTDAPSPACPDRNGNPGLDVLKIAEVDPEGQTHLYGYGDRLGNLTKETILFTGTQAPVTLADGTTVVGSVVATSTFEPTFSMMTSRTDGEGNTTVYLIDATYAGKPTFCPDPTPGADTGKLLGVRDAEGNTTCYAYAANGDLLSITDPRSSVTQFTVYDVFGNATRIVDAAGNVAVNVFDERSRLRDSRDGFTQHATHTYDGLDRRIRTELLDDLGEQGTPQITSVRYRPTGEPQEATDGLGQVTRYLYDDLNRNIEKREEGVLQADGSVSVLRTLFGYDADSNLIAETNPRGVTRLHSYDGLNRRTRTEVQGPHTPNEIVLQSTYDLAGNKRIETDLHGHRTDYVYDGLYRVVETRLPFPNAVVRTAYDRAGNKVRETDANGQPMTYVYDHVYRLTRKTDAKGNPLTLSYDRANNLVREENLSSGLVTEYLNHDGLNRPLLIRQTVPLGAAGLTNAVYDTQYAYDDGHNAVILTNRRGFTTRTDKDGLDRTVRRIVDVGGQNLTTSYTYDGNGNVSSVEDPEGGDIDVVHEYDGLNRKIRSTYVSTLSDAGPVTEEFVYDGNSNLEQYTDRRGTVFRNSYDNLDRSLTATVHESISNGGVDLTMKAYAYDDATSTSTVTDADGNVTITQSDGLHRPMVIDDPDPNGPFPAGLTVFEYDAVNKRAVTDKKGQRTEFDYDALNRSVDSREFDAGGALQTTLHVDYLDQQNQKRETDRRAIVSTSQFDALQRLIQRKRSGLDMATHYGADEVLLETHEYDGNNNQTAFIDAQGNRTVFTYDGGDRQITATVGAGSPVAATTTTTHDRVNNVLTVKDGRNHGGAFDVRYEYDARYRKTKATNSELEETSYAYDANDNVARMTEPEGAAFTTTYQYDELNKLLAVDETPRQAGNTAAGVTRYFYDGNRNRLAQQDANGNLVTYRYDALNRVTGVFQHTVAGSLTAQSTRGPSPTNNPAGGDESTALHWQFHYDLNGNQDRSVDARGQHVDLTYDYRDRVESKTYSNYADPSLEFQMQSVAFTYDGNGNQQSITEVKQLAGMPVTEITRQTFDPLDRLQSRTHYDHDDPVGKTIEYDYDVQGNRTAVTDADGITTSYAFDARNRLQSVTTAAGVTAYTYREDNLLNTVTYPNGSVVDRSDPQAYDRADRLRLTVNRPNLSGYAYTYDKNGNRLTQVETQAVLNAGNPETVTYAYDQLNRLRSVAYGSGASLVYTYEANGNRLTEVGIDPHSSQAVDRRYVYRALASKPGLTFDGVNALSQIIDNLSPGNSITYEYDRDLNQIAKEQGGGRAEFHFGVRGELLTATDRGGAPVAFDYDSERMRIKKRSAGGAETRYLYDQHAVLLEYDGAQAALPTFHKYDFGTSLLSLTQVAGSTRSSQFYLTDGLMSTANLTDEAGGLVQSYRYDVWGRVRDQAGSSDNPRQFTGQYTDDETGLHYFGARYYDDESGRFLSQDPYRGEMHTPPSLHRYLYAYGNPLRFVDPTGYASEEAQPDAKPGDCVGDLCLRHDGTWVNSGEEVTEADVKNPDPCAGVAGPCGSRLKELDDYVAEENRKYLARARAEIEPLKASVARMYELRSRYYRMVNEVSREEQRQATAEREALLDAMAEAQSGGYGDMAMFFADYYSEQLADMGNQAGSPLLGNVLATTVHTLGALVTSPLNFGAGFGAVTGKVQVGQAITLEDGLMLAGDILQVAQVGLAARGSATVARQVARQAVVADARVILGREIRQMADEMTALNKTAINGRLPVSSNVVVIGQKNDVVIRNAIALARGRGVRLATFEEVLQGRVKAPQNDFLTIVAHGNRQGSTIAGAAGGAYAQQLVDAGVQPVAAELAVCQAACGTAAQEFATTLGAPTRAAVGRVAVLRDAEGLLDPGIGEIHPRVRLAPELDFGEPGVGWENVQPEAPR